MISFEHTEIFNVDGALRGMRNSWESWDKSDSEWMAENGEWFYEVGPQDLKLAFTLSKAGNDHAKYLRQILISVDIIAPLYWWKQADQYRVGVTTNSCSTMHRLGSGPLMESDFSFDNPKSKHIRHYLATINQVRQDWINAGKKKPSPEWRLLVQLLADSFIQRRTTTMNYAVLKGMYHSRKNHRLSEWQDFARWVESLPHSELITLKENKKPPYADLDD